MWSDTKAPQEQIMQAKWNKIAGKRFRKVDLRGALIGTGYDTRQKLLYRNLEGVNIIYSSLSHELEVDALVEYDPLAVNQACGIAQSSGNGGEMVIVVVRYQKYTKWYSTIIAHKLKESILLVLCIREIVL